MVTDARIASQLDELASWCLGADARSAAASELRRLGLRSDDDHISDVCQDVVLAVARRIAVRGPIDDGQGRSAVVPYARRTLGHAAVNLVRRGSADRLEQLVDVQAFADVADDGMDGEGPAFGSADPDPPYVQRLRREVHALLATSPRTTPDWAAASALVAVTLADHPDVALRPGTPQPDPRSPGAAAATRWAGLAYAGRTECFSQPETGAVRERRSTALRRVDATVRAAVTRASHDEQVGR